MLIRELRRDHRDASASSSSAAGGAGTPGPEPTAPPEYMDESYSNTDDYYGNNRVPPNQRGAQQQQQQQQQNNNRNDDPNNIDESLPFTDKLRFYWMRIVTWYHELSNDRRALLHILLVILVLYVLFGGRFGLFQGGSRRQRGNYGDGNAYDRFYDDRHYEQRRHDRYDSRRRMDSNDRHGYSQQGRYSSNSDNYSNAAGSHSRYDSRPSRQKSGWSLSSFSFPNPFDGGMMGLVSLAAFGYVCHRQGVNPFQAIWLLNLHSFSSPPTSSSHE